MVILMKTSQSKAIHLALKQFMRDRKKTYVDAAKVLGLSEASVKRLFSTAGLSLQRMEALCNWMGIDIKEVVLEADQQRSFITQLKPEQEKVLVKNPRLLLITYLLLNNWKDREIKEEFDYTDAELNKHFIKLDKMGFIELLPYLDARGICSFGRQVDLRICFWADKLIKSYDDMRKTDANISGTLRF